MRAGEAMGEDAAFEIAAELTFHMGRRRGVIGSVSAERAPGLEVRLNGEIQQGVLGPAPPVRRSAVARRGPPTQYHACPKRPVNRACGAW